MIETWFLTIFLWTTSGDAQLIRFPQTSETACTTAKTGIKYPPLPASVETTWMYHGQMAVMCLKGDQVSMQRLIEPAVTP